MNMNFELLDRLAQRAGGRFEFLHGVDYSDFSHYQFAALIIKDCLYTIQRDVMLDDSTPENIRSRKHLHAIADRFGIEFPLDYPTNKGEI